MGTVGGKIGFAAGVAVAFASVAPMIRLILGPCFFEEGCGDDDGWKLLVAVLASLALAATIGLLTRALVNRFSQRT